LHLNRKGLKNQNDSLVSVDRKYLFFIFLFFIIYCLFLSWSFWFQNVDDAYISFRYGKNLMSGNGLVYNSGEYVEGYTNFLWTIMTAPFTKIQSIDISIFTLSIGLIISVFNIYLLLLISRQFSYLYNYKAKLFVVLPVLLFVLDDSIAFWAIGGMEFPLYILFILSAVYYYFKLDEKRANVYFLSMFLMLITMTRPEGNMIFVLTLFHLIVNWKKVTDFRFKLLTILYLYFVFLILYYGFKYIYYGQLLPNTFYAKGVTDLSMNLLLGIKYLALCIGTRLYIFIFILFIPFKKVFKDFKQSFLLLFSFAYVLYLIAVGGDWMFANRFFVPIIPVFYLLSAIGIASAVKKIEIWFTLSNERKDKLVNAGVVLICSLLFIVTLASLEYNQLIIKDENYKYEMQWAKFGQWLKMNVSPSTIIASGPAGKIPYYSELYTIDMWGLNNDYIAKTRSKRLQAGHKKFDFEYVLGLNPEFIIGYAGFKDEDIPARYEKFNAPEEEYKSVDVVFRLKPEYRINK
jgi:arabinofuranosyltransferase